MTEGNNSVTMTTVSTAPIRQLTIADVPEATDVLVSAFANNAMYRWMLNKPSFKAKLGWIMQRRLSLSINNFGHTYGIGTPLQSVAIWVPPKQTISLPMLLKAGLLKAPFVLGLESTRRVLALLSTTGSVHTRLLGKQPHWYLYAVGTAPSAQGQGLGKRLIQSRLDVARKQGQASYLESSDIANLSLYRGLGFEVCEEMLRQPAAPDFWFMQRPAKTVRGSKT